MASSAAILSARDGLMRASYSDNLPSTKDMQSRLLSDMRPVCSKRRSDASETPARSASVDCFHLRISRNALARSANSIATCSTVTIL